MLSEYEAGQLKPPIYYKDNVVDPEDFYVDEPNENLNEYPLRNRKRIFLTEKSENNYPSRLSDLILNQNNQGDDYVEAENRDQYFGDSSRIDNEYPESGVYTEGGLIYDNASPQQKASEY